MKDIKAFTLDQKTVVNGILRELNPLKDYKLVYIYP